MAKFVFINIPSQSHINPTLPLVQELVARGEEVTYYLTDTFRHTIEATGATFRPYESKIEHINNAARNAGKPIGLPMYMLDESLFVIPQIVESIRTEQPDCLVYDTLCLTGRLIAEILHIPAVHHCMILLFNKKLSQLFQAKMSQDSAAMETFQASMSKLCALYNVQPFNIESIFTHQEALNIVTIPRAFQVDGDAFGEQYRFVGPAIAPRKEDIEFPFELLEEQPVIYISLGTVFNDRPDFFNLCFTAFAGTPWKVVMSIGNTVDQKKLDPIPGNFVVRTYVPQLEVLKYTRICVTHGGMTTIMEALAQAVPLVVTPLPVSDIAVNARRVAELGLGVMLSQEALTAESLRDAVSRISDDPAFNARTLQMQNEIRNAGGYTRTADMLQEFVKLPI
ncbi:MAG: glycosyl transferase [Chloroflexota bacterium]|nr:glycosyl transferase [Chloroflexota bacterium]